MSSDQLQTRFEDAMRPQDDLEAEQWRASAAQKLFGAKAEALRIGRLAVLERVGSGGAGIVYAAYDPKLDRKVAVKLLTSDEEPQALEREARNLAKLTHPNVVHVYDVGHHLGQVYLIMEFVDGGTLADWLERGGTGSWCSTNSCRRDVASPPPTRPASCTATSNRPMSWWDPTGAFVSPTSASRATSTRAHPRRG